MRAACSCYCSGICCVKLAFRQQFPRGFFAILLNRLRECFRRWRQYECRYQGVQQSSISNTERRHAIYTNQEGALTHLARDGGNTMVAGDAKSLVAHKRMLIASISLDFDRLEGQEFNAEGMLKPGLSAESDVRVRWLPRVRAPNRLPAGHGTIPAPTAL